MLAIHTNKTRPATELKLIECPLPLLKSGEVLIKVHAAGVNRPDIMQRQGLYPPPEGASDILGLEVAGVIVDLGDTPSHLKIGDKVCALVTGAMPNTALLQYHYAYLSQKD